MNYTVRFLRKSPFVQIVRNPTLTKTLTSIEQMATDLEVITNRAVDRINAANDRILVEKLVIVGAEEEASRAVRVQARLRELVA